MTCIYLSSAGPRSSMNPGDSRLDYFSRLLQPGFPYKPSPLPNKWCVFNEHTSMHTGHQVSMASIYILGRNAYSKYCLNDLGNRSHSKCGDSVCNASCDRSYRSYVIAANLTIAFLKGHLQGLTL